MRMYSDDINDEDKGFSKKERVSSASSNEDDESDEEERRLHHKKHHSHRPEPRPIYQQRRK
jgi:hypothetical protein